MQVLGSRNKLDWDGSQEPSYVEKALGLGLLITLAAGCAFVLEPFWKALLLAATLCVSTWSPYNRLKHALGDREGVAALLMTLLAAVALITPVVVLGSNMAGDVARLGVAAHEAVRNGLPPPDWLVRLPFIGQDAAKTWTQLSQHGAQIGPALRPYLEPFQDWLVQLGSSLATGTLQIGLSIVLAFFLYRDGPYVEERVEWAMSKLGGWRAQHVLSIAGATIVSVVNGVLGTALIQGVLLGVSFYIAGVPGAIALGGIAVALTLIPLGIVLLWAPAALWLMSQGHTGWAIFIAAWNGLIVSSLDNVLRPYLIGRGVKLPTALVFIGVLGGVMSFGIVGVFIGPVLLAVAHTLFQDWGRTREANSEGAG